MSTLEKRLAVTRDKILDLESEVLSLESSRTSRQEAHSAIDEFIDEQASKCSGRSLDFSRQTTRPLGFSFGDGDTDAAPWLCTLFPDLMREALLNRLPVEDESYGLDRSVLIQSIAEKEKQICELEYMEEQIYLQAKDAGKECERRIGLRNPLVLIRRTATIDDDNVERV